MRISEIMTEGVVTCAPGATVREVAELMRDRNVGSVVLVEHGRPVGVVTDRDLAVNILSYGRGASDEVREHASAPVVTGNPEMDLEEAAAEMVLAKIRRLPVMDGEQLVGIVTMDDLAVKTGDLELALQMTSKVAAAVFPDFYFHQRGG